MTNIYGNPGKGPLRRRLFQVGVETLEKEGWKVRKIPRAGKSSVRQITKGDETKKVSIRTTQDTWIAFPRTKDDRAWATLSEVDVVVAVSVDDPDNPQFAQVHLIDGDEMRERFDRAYRARKAAGHSLPLGRGVWLSLYSNDADEPVSQVGAGAGLDHPAIARVPLHPQDLAGVGDPRSSEDGEGEEEIVVPETKGGVRDEKPLTISEAKRLLAQSLGVDPSNIKITIEA
ncbi:MAG TPA: hypothetical protein VFX98_14965 [Longimicrobiaceae bacterium]|nr:hypothetical protein [Longimicrobiaceae bacterium]